MKASVLFTPAEAKPGDFKNKTTIVIDVLRASSSIVMALQNGARDITPVSTVAKAFAMAKRIGRKNVLLCGERNNKRVRGFDLGNSPSEYSVETVRDRHLVMTTTNGTVAIQCAANAKKIYIASLLNVDAVASKLCTLRGDVVLLCSGREGRFSLEDSICAGFILFRMERQGVQMDLDDAAKAVCGLYNEWCLRIEKLTHTTVHGKHLHEIGLGEDVRTCAQVNKFHITPVFQKGRIVKAE